ncbi:MAG: hypothetical protein FJ206_09180 [Gemmatimonadetes bacterium]|nr:hypothetical protein [Gemmatimonadota bacterium]
MQAELIAARIIEGYLVVGLIFALWFIGRGAGRLDPVAKTGSAAFRLLLLPASTLLWPLLAWRIVRGGPAPPPETNEHRRRARRLGSTE